MDLLMDLLMDLTETSRGTNAMRVKLIGQNRPIIWPTLDLFLTD